MNGDSVLGTTVGNERSMGDIYDKSFINEDEEEVHSCIWADGKISGVEWCQRPYRKWFKSHRSREEQIWQNCEQEAICCEQKKSLDYCL